MPEKNTTDESVRRLKALVELAYFFVNWRRLLITFSIIGALFGCSWELIRSALSLSGVSSAKMYLSLTVSDARTFASEPAQRAAILEAISSVRRLNMFSNEVLDHLKNSTQSDDPEFKKSAFEAVSFLKNTFMADNSNWESDVKKGISEYVLETVSQFKTFVGSVKKLPGGFYLTFDTVSRSLIIVELGGKEAALLGLSKAVSSGIAKIFREYNLEQERILSETMQQSAINLGKVIRAAQVTILGSGFDDQLGALVESVSTLAAKTRPQSVNSGTSVVNIYGENTVGVKNIVEETKRWLSAFGSPGSALTNLALIKQLVRNDINISAAQMAAQSLAQASESAMQVFASEVIRDDLLNKRFLPTVTGIGIPHIVEPSHLFFRLLYWISLGSALAFFIGVTSAALWDLKKEIKIALSNHDIRSINENQVGYGITPPV